MLGVADDEGEFVVKAWIINSMAGIDKDGEWAVVDGVVYLDPIAHNCFFGEPVEVY